MIGIMGRLVLASQEKARVEFDAVGGVGLGVGSVEGGSRGWRGSG